MAIKSIFRRGLNCALILVLHIVLSACGGSGGGNNGSSGGNNSNSPTLTLSKTDLAFTSILGQVNPDTQYINASLSRADLLSGNISVAVKVPDNRFFDVNASIDEKQSTVAVMVTTADSIGVGKHTGQFEIHVCLDSYCEKEVNGSPKVVTVTYNVNMPSVTFEKPQITFNAKKGDRPSATNLLFSFDSIPSSEQSANASYEGIYTRTTYQSTVQDWLTVRKDDYNHLSILVIKDLPAGTYQAEIEIQTSVPLYKAVKVPVIYTVLPGDISVDRSDIAFNISGNFTSTELSKTIVASNLTTAKIDWNVTSNQTWLSAETSNTNSKQADIKIALNKNSALLKNGQHHAIVTVSNKNDQSMRYLLAVTLNLDAIQFDYITPYFGYTEHSQTLYVYGQGFNRLAGRKLTFNQVEITHYQVISDTKLSFTPPKLAAGNYSLAVAGDLENLFSKASHTIIEPEAYEDKTLLFPEKGYLSHGVKHLYEPVSQRIIANNFTSNSIESYQFINGEWKLETIPFEAGVFPGTPFLSIDGKSLYVITSSHYSSLSSVYAIDMNTLKTTIVYGPVYLLGEHMLLLSDEELLIYGSSQKKTINFRTGESKAAKVLFDDFFSNYNRPLVSMDRQYTEINISSRVGIFDAENYSFSLTEQPASRAVNSDGSIRIQNGIAIDANGNALGKLNQGHSLMYFDMLNNKLYGNSFDSQFYIYDFSRKNDAGEFEYRKAFVDIPLESFLEDAFSVSPSGNTLFSITEESLNIRSLK